MVALVRSVMPLKLFSLYMAKDILYRSSRSVCLSTRWQIEMDCGDLQRSTNVAGNQDRLEARRYGRKRGERRGGNTLGATHPTPFLTLYPPTPKQVPYIEMVKELMQVTNDVCRLIWC
jgi:hypothetical protein